MRRLPDPICQTNQHSFVLVGHVTKEGNLAGPKVLEHMIDCFAMLEGGTENKYRILRSQKIGLVL